MDHLLAINGSNSSTSIHLELLNLLINKYNVRLNILPIHEYKLPMYDADLEIQDGIPSEIQSILSELKKTNTILLTSPEHNGSVTAYLKSMLDWLSRAELKFLAGKKIFILSTSKGYGGAQSSADHLSFLVKRFGAEEVITLSIPSNGNNTDEYGDFLPEIDTKIKTFIQQF